MGGFNTYPALDIQNVKSPMDSYGKAMQLKSMASAQAAQAQQLEMGKMQLEEARQKQQEESTIREIYRKNALDKTVTDPLAKTIEDAKASGKVNLETLTGMESSHVKLQTELATKTEKELKNALDFGNMAAGVLDVAKKSPVEQRMQVVKTQLGLLSQNGVDVTPFNKVLQSLPDLKDETINSIEPGIIGHNKSVEQELARQNAASAETRAQAADKAAGKPPAEVADIADYTKTYLAAKGLKDTPSNQLLARDAYYKSKQPFGAQKIQIMQQRADTAEEKAAADKKASEEWKPKVTADEKKKAELAENIAENATAVNAALARRPDLVGAVSGRFTNVEQMIGNNDKDISAIGNRIHNIAMANSGVHGFRSQEGVKETEANILNHFKNGPDAVSGALASNVDSVQTFIDNARPPSYQTHSSQGGAGGYYEKRGGAKSAPSGPPRDAKPGMKWQQNKRTGEYREVPDGG